MLGFRPWNREAITAEAHRLQEDGGGGPAAQTVSEAHGIVITRALEGALQRLEDRWGKVTTAGAQSASGAMPPCGSISLSSIHLARIKQLCGQIRSVSVRNNVHSSPSSHQARKTVTSTSGNFFVHMSDSQIVGWLFESGHVGVYHGHDESSTGIAAAGAAADPRLSQATDGQLAAEVRRRAEEESKREGEAAGFWPGFLLEWLRNEVGQCFEKYRACRRERVQTWGPTGGAQSIKSWSIYSPVHESLQLVCACPRHCTALLHALHCTAHTCPHIHSHTLIHRPRPSNWQRPSRYLTGPPRHRRYLRSARSSRASRQPFKRRDRGGTRLMHGGASSGALCEPGPWSNCPSLPGWGLAGSQRLPCRRVCLFFCGRAGSRGRDWTH